VARVIPRTKYRANRVARELLKLMTRESYAAAAASLGSEIARENGVAAACDGLDALLQS
jgi:rhamnosyltransferase subunit B